MKEAIVFLSLRKAVGHLPAGLSELVSLESRRQGQHEGDTGLRQRRGHEF